MLGLLWFFLSGPNTTQQQQKNAGMTEEIEGSNPYHLMPISVIHFLSVLPPKLTLP
jgi:hypothetical protein